ncbi:MAG: hypothetical protein H5T97_09860 [Firmicutes bacterium]|nr:hypothetical protein [Bacillota bacterium]
MKIEAYFCEWEEDGYCITYPVLVTDEHAACSYGQLIVIIDDEPRGPGDMPPGELQIPENVHADIAPRLRELGYLVCPAPVNERWLECWETAEPASGHWHPEARLVQF